MFVCPSVTDRYLVCLALNGPSSFLRTGNAVSGVQHAQKYDEVRTGGSEDKPKFHVSSFLVESLWHPRRHARHARHFRTDVSRILRGCYRYVTRKLLPWALGYIRADRQTDRQINWLTRSSQYRAPLRRPTGQSKAPWSKWGSLLAWYEAPADEES